MKNKVNVEKNFLPEIFFKKLKTIVSDTTVYFPWYFEPMTAIDKYFTPDHEFMFTHVLFGHNKGPASNFFKDFEPVIYYLNDKIKIKNILRMHINLYTNQNKVIKHGTHVDLLDDSIRFKPRPGVTVSILNFTTCNGGTIIEGKKYPSRENEMLMFNNTIKHGGVVQTDTQTRIVLNINTE